MLNKDVYSIGTFSDSDTKLSCPGSIQIIIKKKRGQVILYKGCGKFQVNRKHTLKKVLEEDDEIFIGKEVFVFSLKEEFDLKKSQIIYNSYLASLDSIPGEFKSEFEKLPDNDILAGKWADQPNNQPGRHFDDQAISKSVKQPENKPANQQAKQPELHSFPTGGHNQPERQLPYSIPQKPFDIQHQGQYQPEKQPFNQPAKQTFDNLLALNDSFTVQLSPILEFDTLLPLVTELAIKDINADKGLLMLFDEDHQLSVKTSVNFHKSIDELDKMTNKIAKEIISGLKANSVFINSVSISGFDFIDSIIIARLRANNTTYGYLCLINKIFDEFNNNDKYIIELLATQAALAIDRINLYTRARNETEVVSKLKRYLPTKTIQRLIESKANFNMNGELEVCTILFVDICNFTTISDSLNPTQIVAFLNEYFTIMTKIIMSYNGSVNKFIGDGMMAVFGAPVKTPNHALEAALAALEMKKHKNILRQKFSEKFQINNFNIRVGINTGLVIYGNVGSLQRMDFTVIGDNVNIASRLESNAPIGGILISRSTYENIYSKVKVTPAKKIKIKGKSDLIEVYELIDKIDEEVIMQRGLPEVFDYSVREHMRVAVKVMAIITKNDKEIHGLIKDISVGGVCLSLNSSVNFKVDEEIFINFKLNDQNNFKNISCSIKHIKKVNTANNINNRLVMGIMFNNLTQEEFQCLANYIDQKCMSWQELPIA